VLPSYGMKGAPTLRLLLIESDRGRLRSLSSAAREAGLSVIAVDSIAKVKRWPTGDMVVTDHDHFTPLWTQVGAAAVLVLVDTPAQGAESCRRGATAWLPRTCSPDTLVALVISCADAPTA
jgi:hypothetical protein